MDEKQDNESVWSEMAGAEPLRQIFGYWPTFHDAFVEKFDVDFAMRTIRMRMRYSDLLTDAVAGGSAAVIFTMAWIGVVDAQLGHYGWDLYGARFRKSGDTIETVFTPCSSGLDGTIRSRSVAVEDVEIIPDSAPFAPDTDIVDIRFG